MFEFNASNPARALIVSDAWHPQINGVVRTIEWMVKEAPKFGVDLQVLGPARFRTMAMPSYPGNPACLGPSALHSPGDPR
jgi:hypothetical protein